MDSVDVTLMISNIAPTGAAALNWMAEVAPTTNNAAPPIMQQSDDHKEAISSEQPSAPATTGTQTTTLTTDQDVQLIIDDGSRENALGLTAGGQFIWLNRFTPSPADFPFNLDEIHILFGAGVGVNVGETVDIYVFEDTDGDGDPATGANFLGALNNAPVQFVDDVNFSVYPIAPIALNGPGDVLIAVVNRTAGTDPGEFPAAMDQTATQARSWIGTYLAGNPPDPPPLPSDDLWGTVDSFGFPGNWMVRGFGSQAAPFIKLLEPTSGTVDPGQTDNLVVRLFGLDVPDTVYTTNIAITSNDSLNPTVNVPVTDSVIVTGILDMLNPIPTTFAVKPNYPNPFNPTTTIKYQLPQTSDVKLVIYNVLGQKVRTLIHRRVEAGYHSVIWDARNNSGLQVATGLYIYRFKAGDEYVKTMKMLLMK